MTRVRASIVIPALNEGGGLPATLDAISAQRQPGDEVIVVDGGSTDDTVALAWTHGADRVVSAPRGRASQLNHGAALAAGDVIVFLHADTILSAEALAALREAMTEPDVAGGAFRLRIDAPARRVRAVARLVNWRSRWLKLPYGDQAIFARRSTFEQLHGFRLMAIMEDVDFIRRLRRLGPLRLLAAEVTTSGRKWQAHGLARVTLAHWSITALYLLGVAPRHLRRLHDRLLPARAAPRPAGHGASSQVPKPGDTTHHAS